MKCPSCSRSFTLEESKIGCNSCSSLSVGCGKVRCPSCKYEFTRMPGIPAALRTLMLRLKRGKNGTSEQEFTCPGSTLLAHLKAGDDCIVEKFLDVGQVRKFLSLGILPGTHVSIVKHSPVVVLRIGYSDFAFDQNLARTVQVHLIGGR